MSSTTSIHLDPGEQWKYLSPQAIPPNVPTTGEDKGVIAPWLDEPPSPPKQKGSALNGKRSVMNFVSVRQGSTTSLPRSRTSETTITNESLTIGSERSTSVELRKPKSMNMFNVIKKKVSRIGKDEGNVSMVPNPPVPPLPSPQFHQSFLPLQSTPMPAPRKHRRKHHAKLSVPPPEAEKEPEFTLDTNLDEMDGIVDMTIRNHDSRGIMANENASVSSPGSGFESSYQSSSFSASEASFHPMTVSPPSHPYTQLHPSYFSNPFSTDMRIHDIHYHRRVPSHFDSNRISPKTPLPKIPGTKLNSNQRNGNGKVNTTVESHSPGWAAPESWAVERKDGVQDVPDYTDSDASDSLGPERSHQAVKQQKRRTRNPKRVQSIPTYQIRIHRSDGTYHSVKCPLTTTVAELLPILNQKMMLDATRDPHTMYVKERERERILAPTERPADLVRRRLEQAGYDVADGLQTLGAEEIGFLIKFIYKSNFLGDMQEDQQIDNNFEFINLTGRSLKTIPVSLHTNAHKIVLLNLSRNPMLEIPLDFIQSCTTLRELRMSNMAMKRVPQSIRHSHTLNRLDISCNRIADLDDSGLDRIPKLATLKAQNNRIDKLPRWFPQLRTLKFLNISNNKFQIIPSVIFEMTNLVDLDISFNMISTLPPEIGLLKNLHSLVIVGNQITRFPPECSGLVSLENLDCRRNNITDLTSVSRLARLQHLLADHNAVHALDLVVGPCMQVLDCSHNDITQLTVQSGPSILSSPFRLTNLNISHAKLSSLDESVFTYLTALETLNVDHNAFRFIPETLGSLTQLTTFTCSDNQLDALPESIGQLQNLVTLDAHNNSLTELPVSMWQCASLETINVTSNLLINLHDPPSPAVSVDNFNPFDVSALVPPMKDDFRKLSAAGSFLSQSSSYSRALPPLARSLQKMYLGENRLTDEVLHPLTALRELRVLNLSFNNIQELPPSFFRNWTLLEEIYLSGNKLSTLPTEDLHRLTNLRVIFLNGNKLQVLPSELGKLKSLTVLDVGSNVLKYNINNWEFDWNWNFNKALRYLNLSGNKRLKIQPDHNRMSMAHQQSNKRVLADFAELNQLRVLGLMDVTVTSNIPEDDELRRVRTSLSEVNQMAYGIADTLGKKDVLGMLDVVVPEFRGRGDECIFAMFGRFDAVPLNNRLSKFLCQNFISIFSQQLEKLDKNAKESVHDAMRRTFLALNKNMHAHLLSSVNTSRKQSIASTDTASTAMAYDMSIFRNGAAGIIVYFVGRTIHVANAGDALAVISRQGTAHLVSKKHEPFDRGETTRIRAAEGWVSPKGLVNDIIEVSRSFGYYHLLPAVNPRPDSISWELSELDEFIIIANRGLWDYVSYRTAVDIARSEKDDPMIAAQKLRDFAISYGADGSTMIMVINVADLFKIRSREATVGSLTEVETYLSRKPKTRNQDIGDVQLSRLPQEVIAPIGFVTLVFTDIRNSTHLWDANSGMPTAMRLHNTLLRRQLRLCGGYEVKTEGDAFMCSFEDVLSALKWCLQVQLDLLHESWPLEILECEDGKETYDQGGKLIERGLSVRMGIHCGTPVCEKDPVTHRMDYFGPMVNRASRISSSAAGGQIMCSADVIREIRSRVLDKNFDPTDSVSKALVTTIEGIGVDIVHVGERRMKGLEIPETLSLVYPRELVGRFALSTAEPDASGSRVQFSVAQMRELAVLCVRLETLASQRVLRPPPPRKSSVASSGENPDGMQVSSDNVILYADPGTLIPHINEKATDRELMAILDSLSLRIEGALSTLTLRCMGDSPSQLLTSLQNGETLDQNMLFQVLSLLQAALPMNPPQIEDS